MAILLPHRALYAAFDVFPSRKGAAQHIQRFAQTLFVVYDGGILAVLGNDRLPVSQREGKCEIVRFSTPVPNFLERTLAFGRWLDSILGEHGASLKLCHFRDPWSGVPILDRPHSYRTIYEVNGLPSIELPYRYPAVGPPTLEKIRALEEFCVTRADRIITPSTTLRDNLVDRGAPAEKITVIPNGAELPPATPRPTDAPEEYLLYFGALQPWQGVDVLLRAFALLQDWTDLRLVLCVAGSPGSARDLQKLARKIGVTDRLLWNYNLEEEDLAPWREHALLSVAPLTECSRNVAQGCAPIKILESMASGVPVIASDLPCIREIVTDGQDGSLIRPDRPGELARAIRILLEYPDLREKMGANARHRIAGSFTWRAAQERLAELYEELMI